MEIADDEQAMRRELARQARREMLACGLVILGETALAMAIGIGAAVVTGEPLAAVAGCVVVVALERPGFALIGWLSNHPNL